MVNTKNILIIGRTGSGKSALANILINKEENFKEENFEEFFKESNNSISETLEIKSKEIEIGGINYRIIDTIGIGNTKLNDEEIACKIFKSFHNFKDGLTQILFIIDGRFTQEEIKFYNIIKKKILDEDITKFTTIVRTKFFNFRNVERCKNDHELLRKENRKISKLINSCKNVIYVDNPSLNSNDYDEEEIILHKKRREECRDILVKHLRDCRQGFSYKPKNLELINNIFEKYSSGDEEYKNKFMQLLKEKIEALKNKGFFKKNKEKLEKKLSNKKTETEEVKNLPLEAFIEVNNICKQM